MTTTTTIKIFPTQKEVDNFLAEYFNLYPQDSFHLSMLVDRACEYFDISPTDAALCPNKAHGIISPKTSYIEQFVHWGCIHLISNHLVKRIGPNEYQSIIGPKPIHKLKRISRKLIKEAMVSVKMLKNSGWEPERIICELGTWSDDIIEAAIKKVFVNI